MAIKSIESAGSGGYQAIGPVTKNGNRAYGAYQVMDFNIPKWTKAVTGRAMTPDEFLDNPDVQDAVFDRYFGGYIKKYGNVLDASSMWFTGRPRTPGSGASSDILGTTGTAYVKKFADAYAKAGGHWGQGEGGGKFLSQGAKEKLLADEIAATKAVDKANAAQQVAAASDAQDKFQLAIEVNPHAGLAADILENEDMDGGQKAALHKALRTRLKDETTSRQNMARFTGDSTWNSLNTKDRKALDDVHKQFVDGGLDPKVSADVITAKTGIAPRQVINSIRAGLSGGNAAEFEDAITQASRLNSISKHAFLGVDGYAGIRDDVAAFDHNIRLGYDGSRAAQMVKDLHDPAKEVDRDFIKNNKKEIDKWTGADDVTKALEAESRFVKSDYDIGFSNTQTDAIVSEYRDVFERSLMYAQGDFDVAKSVAAAHFKTIYNTTNVGGEPRVMRRPPEQYYPAVGGSHDYIQNQLVADLKISLGVDVRPENIAIFPDGVTEAEVESGMTPSYQVFYRDPKTGLLERAYGDAGKQRAGRFRADVEQASVEYQEELAVRKQKSREKQAKDLAVREDFEGTISDALEAGPRGSPSFTKKLVPQMQRRTKQLAEDTKDTRPVLPDPEVFDEAMP
jgi:hypothetical protein